MVVNISDAPPSISSPQTTAYSRRRKSLCARAFDGATESEAGGESAHDRRLPRRLERAAVRAIGQSVAVDGACRTEGRASNWNDASAPIRFARACPGFARGPCRVREARVRATRGQGRSSEEQPSHQRELVEERRPECGPGRRRGVDREHAPRLDLVRGAGCAGAAEACGMRRRAHRDDVSQAF